MTDVQSRTEPNRPGFDPVLAFRDTGAVPMNAKAQPGAAFTLEGADFYKRLICGSLDPVTVTIPQDAILGEFPVGGLVAISREGAAVTIRPASGVTLKRVDVATAVRIDTPQGAATLQKAGANSWIVFGNVIAVA